MIKAATGAAFYSVESTFKNLIDQLNFQHTRVDTPTPQWMKDTNSISFYDSMVVFEKGSMVAKRHSQTGTT